MPAPAAEVLTPPAAKRRDRGGPVRGSAKRRKDTIAGYLFIAPAIIGLLLFVGYPMVTSLYHSFTEWNGLTPAKWIGFGNYVEMFTDDPKFWPSIEVTLLWVVVSVPVTIAAGLALAVLVDRGLKGVKIFRTVFYLPVVLPAVAVLTLWKYIYDPTYGLANEVLRALHLPTVMWLGDSKVALASILIVGVWGIGGTMMIFLAGLQAVPTELTEAAKVDGAGAVRRFMQVTLPMIGRSCSCSSCCSSTGRSRPSPRSPSSPRAARAPRPTSSCTRSTRTGSRTSSRRRTSVTPRPRCGCSSSS
ncbi:sugar ABC transporter permease [Curtobacterium flaccumfaciens]|nr:sugar ABC transporter permease [Curtobacterium flaccumfaciens]